MKNVAILFLLALSAHAGVSRTPSADGGATCSGRPCRYDVTVAGAEATSEELAELQSLGVIDDVQCGDTIRLQSGKTWKYTTGAFSVYWPCPADNRVIFETSDIERFPINARVTSAYIPLMPKILNETGGSGSRAIIAHSKHGGSPAVTDPARGFIVRGIYLAGINTTTGVPSGVFDIGQHGAAEYEYVTVTLTDIGDHLTYVANPDDVPLLSPLQNLASSVTRHLNYQTLSEDGWIQVNGVDTINLLTEGQAGWPTIMPPYGLNPVATGTDATSAMSHLGDGLITFREARDPGDVISLRYKRHVSRVEADFPRDITIDRCFFEVPRLNFFSGNAPLQVMGYRIAVYNSVIRGVKGFGGVETKGIGGVQGCFDCVFANNEIEALGINFIQGGGITATRRLSSYLFRDNLVIARDWMRTTYWNANTYYQKGSVIRSKAATNGLPWLIAMNSGTSGATEPTWLTTSCSGALNLPAVSKTQDGGVEWGCVSTSTTEVYQRKNSFETKMSDGALLERNGIYNSWGGEQWCAITIKNAGAGYRGNGSKNVTIRNNWIENVVCPINLSTNDDMTTLDGVPAGWDRYGSYGPHTLYNNVFAHINQNYVEAHWGRNGSCIGYGWMAGHSNRKQMRVEHNVMDTFSWDGKTSGATYGPDTTGTLGTTNCTNTYIQPALNTGGRSGDVVFNSNIVMKAPFSPYILRTGSGEGTPSVLAVWQGAPDTTPPSVIAPRRFDGNVFIGGTATNYPQAGGSHPGNANTTPASVSSIGFVNWQQKNFALTRLSTHRRAGYNGMDSGIADWHAIPQLVGSRGVGKVDVKVSGHVAVISFRRTAGALVYPAQILVSSTRDMLTPIADLDPATYTTPELSSLDHLPQGRTTYFVLGRNVPLPAGTYWYEIYSGGGYAASEINSLYEASGSFTVAGDASGTSTIAEHRGACVASASVTNGVPLYRRWQQSGATFSLIWGTSYSAATDTISDGATVNVTCDSGRDAVGAVTLTVQ
jgi:hypothetical protein